MSPSPPGDPGRSSARAAWRRPAAGGGIRGGREARAGEGGFAGAARAGNGVSLCGQLNENFFWGSPPRPRWSSACRPPGSGRPGGLPVRDPGRPVRRRSRLGRGGSRPAWGGVVWSRRVPISGGWGARCARARSRSPGIREGGPRSGWAWRRGAWRVHPRATGWRSARGPEVGGRPTTTGRPGPGPGPGRGVGRGPGPCRRPAPHSARCRPASCPGCPTVRVA